MLCHCPGAYIWNRVSGTFFRSRAKIWLAMCVYLYFLASGLEYSKVWNKGQRFMKSRQEVILKVTECINVQKMVWTWVPFRIQHTFQTNWSTILPLAHSVLPPLLCQNAIPLLLQQWKRKYYLPCNDLLKFCFFRKGISDQFSPLSCHKGHLLQSFGVCFLVVSIHDSQRFVSSAVLGKVGCPD